jgi:hypothetical protein
MCDVRLAGLSHLRAMSELSDDKRSVDDREISLWVVELCEAKNFI